MENRYLLISDVDGTLLGDDDALARFVDWYAEWKDRLTLVYSSGRFCDSIVESIRNSALPEPAAVIGGVGTEIRLYPSCELITEWQDSFQRWHPLRITSALSRFSELELQPAEFLSDFKISYYLNDASVEFIDEMYRQLEQDDCRVSIVYSSKHDLDILPYGVNKGAAARFLATRWKFPKEHVLVAGDSENDASMFMRNFRGVVVANAQPGLRTLDAPDIYHAQSSYAAGVCEGLDHWLNSSPCAR